MGHESEYHDAMLTVLELIWGMGFMAPGGEGNVAQLVDCLDVRDQRVLDVGCGLGGPAFLLAGEYGARVVGMGLTYAMETLERHAEILREVGFTDVEVRDSSDWYRRRVREEYEKLRSEHYPCLVERIG